MKKAYIMLSVVVLVLVISSYLLHFSNNEVSVSNSISGNNLLTGFAGLNYDELVAGDSESCFVYGIDCPDDAEELFRVNDDFFSVGGGHVAEVDNDDFQLRMCCRNILGPDNGGDRDFSLFYTGYTALGGNSDITQEYGSHIYPNNLADKTNNYVALETRIGNYVEYVAGECPVGWNCIAKASPLDTEGYDFYNSHIWDCNRTFDAVDMVSICYKPEQQTDCISYGGVCTEPGYIMIEGELYYCSFGIDDLQDPDDEEGGCCYPGEIYDDFLGQCVETEECGFDIPNDKTKCYLDEIDENGRPIKLFEKEYFDQPNCVKWNLQQSCCWNIERFGDFGNYYCDINTLTWQEEIIPD